MLKYIEISIIIFHFGLCPRKSVRYNCKVGFFLQFSKSRNLSSCFGKSFSFPNWRYIIWVLPVKKLIDGKFLAKVFAKLEIIFLNSKLGERFHLDSQESQLKMLWHFQITISHLGWNFRITKDYINIENPGRYIGITRGTRSV